MPPTPSSDSLSLRLPHTRVNHATHRELAGSFFKRHAVTTPHTQGMQRDAPTACRHTVSGTLSLRSRGTFHHSLTVLSAIGHQGIFRLTRWSWQIHTGFLGPCATRDTIPARHTHFSYGGLTLYARPFACPSPIHVLSHSPTSRQTSPDSSHNTATATPAEYHTATV